MIRLIENKVFFKDGNITEKCDIPFEEARKNTIAYGILTNHNTGGDGENLKIKFDAMASHDITYVGIIQTARAADLKEFPMPYVLTNCHNSLCAVGGTINEDDHAFGLSAAKKYGGIYVPAHQAVIHAYMREMMSGCGKMILGSDSHTRYGALGTLAIGEGGPELVKQLLCKTYNIKRPEVVGVYLKGQPKAGVGPHDVALAIVGAAFKKGFVVNKIMEFVGEGIANLPIEFRNGIDVMTTETKCLSSIWVTDDETKRYFDIHGRSEDFKYLKPKDVAGYDAMMVVDLSEIEPMIALPFHPSNTYTISEFNRNADAIINDVIPELKSKITPYGVLAQQGVIAGCAGGTFDNLCAAADILSLGAVGNGEFSLSAYPASQPEYIELMKNGVAASLLANGVSLRTAFCGPCFGAGDVPSNGALSLRHSTRNFPNREGSKPGEGQSAYVALMDARSIAATAVNGGIITPATELDPEYVNREYHFDDTVYKNRVYFGYGKADSEAELKFGPNICNWPSQSALEEDIVLGVCSVIKDEVTTTDELIPSGETSSFRSNPKRIASYTLSRKDPEYVGRATAVAEKGIPTAIRETLDELGAAKDIQVGSVIYAKRPGDGSAREHAASCQRVLGGLANIAIEYCTKRYRSNLINWGLIPFYFENEELPFDIDWFIYVKGVRSAIEKGETQVKAYAVSPDRQINEFSLTLPILGEEERSILLDGCLINFCKA